jgi:ABC-type multidrug transport system fused ATPase/permease subunit
MKRLLKIAFSKARYRYLLLFTLVAALGFTVATQLEMFTLGVITRKGPDFFELFGNGSHPTTVTHQELTTRWKELDESGKGIVDQEDVSQFMETTHREGIVDRGINTINRYIPLDKSVSALVLVIIFVAVFKALTLFAYRFGTKLFAIKIGKDLRQQYFEHIQSLPMSFYQAHNIGALSSRAVNDAYIIADGINSTLVNYFQTPFALISTLSLCFAISWKLSCVVFIGMPLLIGPIIFIAKRIRRLSRQLQKKQEAFASVLVEFLSGVQTIKLFAMEDFSLKKYKEHNEAMADLEIRNARYDISARPIMHTIAMVFLVTALLFGLWGLCLPLHEVLFFCGLLSAVYEPVKKFAEENGRIQRGAAACDRLYEVLDLTPSIHDEKTAHESIQFSNRLSFENVTFSYGEHNTVLSSVSFHVNKGEMVAIVGPTGGGKSTIVSLLTRLFEPQNGVITIDGVPIQQISQKTLREFFAVVPQKPFLFHDTVRENIRFGRAFSDEAVRYAALQAHAEEFIHSLPEGYETFLAEAGKSLSGGQQQRLAIARALIKQSPILVLDEATSALDSASELQIKLVLKELKGAFTQIVIAHRLSTIEDADRIIVIEGGKKVGDGTREELLQTCPTFKRLWMPQTMGPVPDRYPQV